MALFSNIQSSWAHQYGSIDTKNIKIRPLVIILWWNILGHQQAALNSLLTTIPNRNFYRTDRGGCILYCSRIRKNEKNRRRTENREQRKQLQRPSNAVPMERRVKRANITTIVGNGLCMICCSINWLFIEELS